MNHSISDVPLVIWLILAIPTVAFLYTGISIFIDWLRKEQP